MGNRYVYIGAETALHIKNRGSIMVSVSNTCAQSVPRVIPNNPEIN